MIMSSLIRCQIPSLKTNVVSIITKQGLHNKDNHDKVATFLNGDEPISAIGKIAETYPKLTGDAVEAITGILKKQTKDFLVP